MCGRWIWKKYKTQTTGFFAFSPTEDAVVVVDVVMVAVKALFEKCLMQRMRWFGKSGTRRSKSLCVHIAEYMNNYDV